MTGTSLTATNDLKQAASGAGIREALWFLFPLGAALIYRQALNAISFTAAHGGGPLVVLAIAAAIVIPLTGLAIASRSAIAARAGYITIVIPPLFTATAGLVRLAAHGGYWTALAFSVPVLVIGGGLTLSLSPGRLLLKLHRTTAIALLIFVLAHLTNHPFALSSLAAHKAVQDALRVAYRNFILEPLLIAALVVQALSGVALAWRDRHRQGFLNHAQAASGFFIAVFLCSHLMATLVNGRALAHIETDFIFAAGGRAGLLHSPGMEDLIPYYFLAPVAFFTHVGIAARRTLLRRRSPQANRLSAGLFALGVALSVLILIALCGTGGLSHGV
jgi:succinate dehydrogenase/fumarate reductase cytochrome b subunit